MKKQVLMGNIPPAAVTGSLDVTTKKYYGVNAKTYGTRATGFITRMKYESGNFTLKVFEEITNGNGWVFHQTFSILPAFVEFLIGLEFIVYEFDSERELLAWALEEMKKPVEN